MKMINFEDGQQGEEWYSWRKGGIGASDISVIMGTNSFLTLLKLWEIKCGYREEEALNPAMQHGIRHEEHVRQRVNERFQLNLHPLCVEDDEKPHFRASLDGWDKNTHTLVEIKCPVSEKILDAARISQSIPSYWYDQMQWQIMLTDPKKAFLAIWDYRNEGLITLDFFGSNKRILEMREKAQEFWHLVQIGKPPVSTSKDYKEIEDEELQKLLFEYEDLHQQEKGIKERKEEVRKKIIPYGKGENFTAYGFKGTLLEPRKTYDIDKMRSDGIDVDLYLKSSAKGEGAYKITVPK